MKTIKFNDFLNRNYEDDNEYLYAKDFWKALILILAVLFFGADILKMTSNIFVGLDGVFVK